MDRKPAQYFTFASRGVPVSEIRSLAKKYDKIMVGFDAGNVEDDALEAAKDVGAELEIYVEGPGGETGSSGWAPDERARIKAAAKKAGIDTGDKNWMKEWDDWGWRNFTFHQLADYKKDGFEAAEIDNLERVLGYKTKPRLNFLKMYAYVHSYGFLPRLIIKNLDEEFLEVVVDSVKKGVLPREMFSEFHISEKGSGDRTEQQKLTKQIAIRTLASNNTYDYDAKGEYGLEDEFSKW